jgi:hypothetical protein
MWLVAVARISQPQSLQDALLARGSRSPTGSLSVSLPSHYYSINVHITCKVSPVVLTRELVTHDHL